MTDKIMQLAGVIQREMDSLQSVAQNTANLNTIGYKSMREFTVMQPSISSEARALDQTVQLRQQVNVNNGALQQTGRTLDLAISGDAWFVVQTPEGLRLTRDGRFHIGEHGTWVNPQGLPVMGESGTISVAADKLKIGNDGSVLVDGERTDQLRLVSVESADLLTPSGSGLYTTQAQFNSAKSFTLHQGMLERSNANMGQDMVKMMELSRHIESVQRALVSYNGILESGINQIGK